nr:alanine--glyoxylate aminotransferase family protein [Paenibacillus xylanexedens]
MKKLRMATPGPTYVPQDILLAGAQELVHHRSTQMEEVMERINHSLPILFGTEQKVFTLLSSGTGAMEAAVANCFQEHDKVLVVSNGYFGERFADIAKVYGVQPIEIVCPWGSSVDIAEVEKAYREHPDVKGILVVYSETSTGVTNEIQGLADFFRDKDVLVIVDAISGLLSHELVMDQWGLDVVLAASHKGFMMPPGLAFVCISEKAWQRLEQIEPKTYYFSFKRFRTFYPMSPSSPGVSLIFALQASIEMLMKEGLSACHQRHYWIAQAAQAGLTALGFDLFVTNPQRRSHTVTTAIAPQGLDTSQLLHILSSRYGLSITGGQGEFKGKMIRVGHIGSVDMLDMFSVFGAIELALADMGASFTKGSSIAAIQEVQERSVYHADFVST